jgi:hypothetical protein
VSTVGNDSTCARGGVGRACRTFGRAYQLAQCGDVVEIAGGSYAEQTLVERGSCSAPITLQAKAGQTPFTQRVWLGSCRGCYSSDAPDDLVLRGIKTAGVIMWGDVEDVTLDRIDGGSFLIRGGKRITVSGSDWGPCPSPSHGSSANQCLGYSGPQQTRIAPQSAASDTADILIQGNVFHDHPAVSPDHWECIYTTGGTNVTIRGNHFYNCENTASVWLDDSTKSHLAGTWLFEMNRFGQRRSPSAIGLAQLPFERGRLLVRMNTFAPGQGVRYHDGVSRGADSASVHVVANILGRRECIKGAVYGANLLPSARGCDASDRTEVFGYVYVDDRLRPTSRSANAVRAAFTEASSARKGRSLTAIARSLARQGRPAPPGGWNARTLTSLLTDRVYLGRNLGIPSGHPPLVSAERWRAVQRVLEANA